jgi:hypothetical protein
MRKLKYLLILVLSIGLFNSCLVDDETNYDQNDTGLNLVTFELTKTTVAGIADGTEYTFPMKVKLVGPTMRDIKSDLTVTVAVDPSSTAIEGTHFRIDDPDLVLTADNNYLGLVYVTMTTLGIPTPLPKNPILALKIQSATGDAKVTSTAKLLEVEMNFACYTEMQGTYTMVCTSSSGAVYTNPAEVITKIDVETYYTTSVGTWGGGVFVGNGVTFVNSCNVLNMPQDLNYPLANTYSNAVWSHRPGEYNQETGVITLYYTIEFAAGNRTYTSIFTPNK